MRWLSFTLYKPGLSIYFLVGLLPLLWIIALLFGIPVFTIAIITIVILFSIIGLLLLKQRELKKSSASKDASTGIHADDKLLEIRPEIRAEIEMLEQKFVEMTAKIRKSELGKGLQGSKALYALPWYLTLGPFASGKSTLIRNSKLEFPLGIDEEIKGIGGTRSCDWWFTNTAILLDTAGRYTAEREERAIWLALLDQLKKYRRKQPLNGVIVCVSLPDVVKATSSEIEWQAQNIRSRLDDLIQRLGLLCPIYVVFTKCDLVTGFVESFGQLNRDQVDQVLGYTLSKKQMADPQARALVETEFRKLVDNLEDYCDSRSNIAPPSSRDDIYLFPQEMATARENVALFLSKVFWQHPFQKTPLFRGFYFTSAAQVGAPEDFVSKQLTDEFNLTGQPAIPPVRETDSKSYFIKNLFHHIIVGDQNIARRMTWTAMQGRWLRIAAITTLCLFTLLGLYGIWKAYDYSEQRLLQLDGDKQAVRSLIWRTSDQEHFSSLTEKFHQTILDLEQRAAQPGISSLWMDQSHRVLPRAYVTYFDAMAPVVKDNVYTVLEKRLENELKDTTPVLDREERVYDVLRAYTFFNSCRRSLNLSSQIFLGHYLTSAYTANPEEKNSPLLKGQMHFFAKAMTWLAAQPKGDEAGSEFFNMNTTLANGVRRLLASTRTPTARNIFRDIKRKGEEKLATSHFRITINPAEFDYFDLVGRSNMQDIFTIKAWDIFFKDYIEGKKWDSGPDCVMGEYGTAPGAELTERQKEDMVNEIKKVYFENYSAAWLQFINELDLKPLATLGDAANVLERLDSKNSQLLRLLMIIKDQTQFKNIKRPVGFTERGSQSIDVQFEDVRWLVGDKAGEKAMNELTSLYRNIATRLNTVKNDRSQIRQLAAETMDSNSESPLAQAYRKVDELLANSDLKSGNSPVHEALRGLLKRPVDRAFEALLIETQDYLNEQWAKEIISSNPAKGEISADNISRFFNENGTFWKFFESQIHPFVDKQTLEIATKNGIGLKVSEKALIAFRQARELRESLSGSGGGTTFTISPVTPVKDNNFPRFDDIAFSLGADGEEGIRRWSKSTKANEVEGYDFSWPGPNPGGGAFIRLIDQPGFPFTLISVEEKTKAALGFKGTGGWNKLLSMARVKGNRYTWRVPTSEARPRIKEITFIIQFGSGTGSKLARGIVDFDCPPRID